MRRRRHHRGSAARGPGARAILFRHAVRLLDRHVDPHERQDVVTALDYILPAYFSKMFGGSRAGIIGATVGVFAGMILLGPLGIVLGPFVGAVAGELLHDRENADKALKVGFGSLVSFFVGSGMKIAVSAFMMYYIWKDMTAVLDSMW